MDKIVSSPVCQTTEQKSGLDRYQAESIDIDLAQQDAKAAALSHRSLATRFTNLCIKNRADVSTIRQLQSTLAEREREIASLRRELGRQ